MILAATNLVNPDAFIARTNINLMYEGRDYDSAYNFELSDDAIPAILSGVTNMNFEDRCRTKTLMKDRYGKLGEESDLRSWNLSRRSVASLLKASETILHEQSGCPDYRLNYHNSN